MITYGLHHMGAHGVYARWELTLDPQHCLTWSEAATILYRIARVLAWRVGR